jgi:hypothetical protein
VGNASVVEVSGDEEETSKEVCHFWVGLKRDTDSCSPM